MKSNIKIILTALQSLIIAVAVILSGAHAKDVVKIESLKRSDIVKTYAGSGDEAPTKVSAELHNHVDKQTLKVFGQSADNQQADRRSLHLLTKHDESKTSLALGAELWLRLLAAKLVL